MSNTNQPTTTINISRFLTLAAELDNFAKVATRLREKLILALPAKKGSRLDFMQESIRGMQDVRNGKTAVLKSISDLDKPLKKLFPSAQK